MNEYSSMFPVTGKPNKCPEYANVSSHTSQSRLPTLQIIWFPGLSGSQWDHVTSPQRLWCIPVSSGQLAQTSTMLLQVGGRDSGPCRKESENESGEQQ